MTELTFEVTDEEADGGYAASAIRLHFVRNEVVEA